MVTSNPVRILNDVKPFKDSWKVEIKVLHSWTQHSNYSGGDTLDFVLADKTGVKIHCICKRSFFSRVKKLQVGQWKFIENFSEKPAHGKYRPTSHKYKISITGNSNVTDSTLKIDDDFLTLTPLQAISDGSLDPNLLVDVIGRAIDIGDLQAVQVLGKEKKKLELTLTDTNDQHIGCCLWGRFAEQVLSAYKNGEENNILCLLRFAKINVYKGQVQITNAFEISNLVINPTGIDVEDYQKELPNNELALTSGTGEVVKSQRVKREAHNWFLYPEKSILDVVMATEIEKCIVKATIYAIDTDWAWYYFGCVKCNYKKVTNITRRDVVPIKHVWHCDTCNQSVTKVKPKFKLHLLIKDDTGETKVMLLDSVAEPIVGVSAELLLDGSLEEVEDPEDLPDAITHLIGKTFKFGVHVNKDNIDYGADIYNIGKSWGANEVISQYEDVNTEDTHANTLSSDNTSGQASFVSIENGDTSGLSSTPLSKRLGVIDIEDLSSTSKKQSFKKIKVEKNVGE